MKGTLMPNIVSAQDLRTVLGVSVSLYPDSYLDDIINTAEAVVLPMLVSHSSAVAQYEIENNILYIYTVRPHRFVTGQSVQLNNVAASIDATYTVTADYTASPYVFTAAKVTADVKLRAVIPNGSATLVGKSAADIYANNDAVENAIIMTSSEIFQAKTAAGNSIDGVDFQVSPWRMSRQLLTRVSALLAPFQDVETMAQ
jgi:hypothetical protein